MKKVPGCTPQERAAMTAWLADGPLLDAFRALHPHAAGAYTYWSARNVTCVDCVDCRSVLWAG